MRDEDQDKLRAFNEEWDKANSTDMSNVPIDKGPNAVIKDESLSLADQVAAVGANMNQGVYTPPVIPTTGDRCSECGVMHPPVAPGQKCPLAADKENETKLNAVKDRIEYLVFTLFSTVEGQELLDILDKSFIQQPVAPYSESAAYAHFREGENNIIRMLKSILNREKNNA